jgi:hypothetical protein
MIDSQDITQAEGEAAIGLCGEYFKTHSQFTGEFFFIFHFSVGTFDFDDYQIIN